MKIAIVSPHADDAIFSVAEHMLSRPQDQHTILCPLNGIPTYGDGVKKHMVLLEEHATVCRQMRVAMIDGHFLDDVYAKDHTDEDLYEWFRARQLSEYDQVWIPAGIHHPDHVSVREAVDRALCWIQYPGKRFMYEELPYRVLYPELACLVINMHSVMPDMVGCSPNHLDRKKELCRMYASQVDDQLERSLYAHERMWELKP